MCNSRDMLRKRDMSCGTREDLCHIAFLYYKNISLEEGNYGVSGIVPKMASFDL